jgi:hypothetical protein
MEYAPVILVDPVDEPLLRAHAWRRATLGYIVCEIRGKTVYLHRKITNAPPGKVVDHINGNKLDNRRANLRVVTNAENVSNRLAVAAVSGHRGVGKAKLSRRWRARVTVRGVKHYLGTFDSSEAAAAVARDFRLRNLPGATT